MLLDQRVQRARAKAGLTGIFGYDFECPVCGGLADVRIAMAARDSLVTDVLELSLSEWDAFDDAVSSSSKSVRAATLQRIARLPLDEADGVLAFGGDLLLLAEEEDGYGPAKLVCQPCYRRALDDLLDSSPRFGPKIRTLWASTARAADPRG